MNYSNNEPRNWKWMTCAALMVVMIPIWGWMVGKGGALVDWAIVPIGLGAIFALGTLINLWRYVEAFWTADWIRIRQVMNETPEVLMFQAARTMHPQAVENLLKHRRTLWRVKYIPQKDLVDWVLDEAPSVHVGFVEFVLDHSSDTSMMPKHGFLSEGSKEFDPEGLILDRDQYDDLQRLWQSKGICTQAFGNQAARFMPTWTIELLRHVHGIGAQEIEKPNPQPLP